MSVNVKKMLKAVKEWPCLYDNRDKDYRNMDLKYKAWEEVTASCITDFSKDMTQMDKDERVSIVKTKWRNVSDYYKREKREELYMGSLIKPVKYVYSNDINFLDDVLESNRLRKSELYSKRVSSQESQNDYDNELAEDMETYEVPSPSSSHTARDPQTPEPLKKKIKTEQFDPLNVIEEITPNDNCDKYFLMSILSHMRSMEENDKLDFKIQVLQFIKNINNKNC